MPSQSQVHVDALLSNVSVAVLQTSEGFVANKVFPDISVAKQSDKYAVFPMADFNRNSMQKRADGTESAGDNFKLSTDSYFCDVFALHKDIGDQTRANADSQFALDRATTEFLTLKALINKEANFASAAMGTGIWGTNYAGISGSSSGTNLKQWSDATATPVQDVRAVKFAVQLKTGFRPNIAVCTRDVMDVLIEHPNVISRVSGGATTGSPAVVTERQVAQLFELDEIYVMDAIYNSSAEGVAEASVVNSLFKTKAFLLLYRTPAPGMFSPNAGYTFSWSGFLGQAGMGTRVSNIRMPALRADRIEIECAYDVKITAPELGAYLTTIIA